MIGIYKITNKLNGKIYIGQSIHCGKRFDEHCKNNSQFIDQMIEFDGIENYTFEILKRVESREDLSYWEDYYIILYNTYYPNGYNKRWNTNQETQNKIKEKIELLKSGIVEEQITYKQINYKQNEYKQNNYEQNELKMTYMEIYNIFDKVSFALYLFLYYNFCYKHDNQMIIKDTYKNKDNINISLFYDNVPVSRNTCSAKLKYLFEEQILYYNGYNIVLKEIDEIIRYISYEEFLKLCQYLSYDNREFIMYWLIKIKRSWNKQDFYLKDLYFCSKPYTPLTKNTKNNENIKKGLANIEKDGLIKSTNMNWKNKPYIHIEIEDSRSQ